jgi:hypothetical protein
MRTMASVVGLIAVGTLLGGCQAQLDPLDEASLRAGVPTFDFVWAGLLNGPVKVTMPSGEVLTGDYHIIDDYRPVDNAASSRALSARAVGPRGTRIRCDGFIQGGYFYYYYYGSGICETGGHRYRLTF